MNNYMRQVFFVNYFFVCFCHDNSTDHLRNITCVKASYASQRVTHDVRQFCCLRKSRDVCVLYLRVRHDAWVSRDVCALSLRVSPDARVFRCLRVSHDVRQCLRVNHDVCVAVVCW